MRVNQVLYIVTCVQKQLTWVYTGTTDLYNLISKFTQEVQKSIVSYPDTRCVTPKYTNKELQVYRLSCHGCVYKAGD